MFTIFTLSSFADLIQLFSMLCYYYSKKKFHCQFSVMNTDVIDMNVMSNGTEIQINMKI